MQRFTTFETVEETPLLVIKKDGMREEFSKEKMLRGLVRACEKRPVPIETLEDIVLNIERQLRDDGKKEVQSEDVGELVMGYLAEVDDVAMCDLHLFIGSLKILMFLLKN
ncbi:ribonucleotide reductase transcriptional regulator NrdR [Bacillus sp. JCM 19047]|nr:ribonucleotide reductase transcriptional regulator NrdR [Bacillus sp. JCM 19047]